MEYIDNKDLFHLIIDTLKLREATIIEHGYRTAYIVYRMLQCTDHYEPFELADIVVYVTLHDIGAYITEKEASIHTYDLKDFVPHSVMGYLFCKHLSPHKELAPVVLYHHTDYNKFKSFADDRQREIAAVLHIAERADIYHSFLKEQFTPNMFDRLSGNRLWDVGMTYLHQAEEEHHLFEKLVSGDYQKELDEILEYLVFSNEETEKYLQVEMYLQGLQSRSAVVHAACCVRICQWMTDRLLLSDEEKRILSYAALLHDIGMLAVPRELLQAERRLTDSEFQIMETHVENGMKALESHVPKAVLDIIVCHHERSDGSGYPKHLKGEQISQAQQILQLADIVAAMVHVRSYRPALKKEEIIRTLTEEKEKRHFQELLVNLLLDNYDEIYKELHKETRKVLSMYQKLVGGYAKVSKQFRKEQP